eukprot:COSAG06_NODE_35476_length_459_cov_2.002778_2_plen_25_part_01
MIDVFLPHGSVVHVFPAAVEEARAR